MQKGQILIWIIVGGLVIVIAGGALFYTNYSNNRTKSFLTPTVSQTPQPTPVDETANWKTYTNNKYAFSLNYPPNWKIEENMGSAIFFSIESPDYKFDDNNKVEEQVTVGTKISFNILSSTGNYSEPKEGEIPTLYFDTVNNKQIMDKISNITNITIDGRKAAKYDLQRLFKEPLLRTRADIVDKTFVYRIEMMYVSPISKNIFDDILSTFKFL